MSTDRLVRESDVEEILSFSSAIPPTIQAEVMRLIRLVSPVPPAGISREAVERIVRQYGLEDTLFAETLRALPEAPHPSGISREEVLEALDETGFIETEDDWNVFAERIRALPESKPAGIDTLRAALVRARGAIDAWCNVAQIETPAARFNAAADLKAIDEALQQ
jgi:hypothetical protein